MSSFFEIIFEVDEGTKVLCPFPHTTNGGMYLETTPSATFGAGINGYDTSWFHCFGCGAKLGELSFISKYMGISHQAASQIKALLNTKLDVVDWEITQQRNLMTNHTVKQKVANLGFSDKVVQELKLGTDSDGTINFPVLVFNKLVDVRRYNPEGNPKVKSNYKAPMGMIIPFDTWREEKEKVFTVIAAGEKDMAIARTHGFNAITITGGERSLPKLFQNEFANLSLAIIYDNDDAGKDGAASLATFLQPLAKEIKVVDLSKIVTEKGGDLHDYFNKYGKTRKDLLTLIKKTPCFTERERKEVLAKEIPLMTILEAGHPKNIGKIVRSNIKVPSTTSDQFSISAALLAVKVTPKGETDVMELNARREWFLNEDTLKDVLYLMDSNLKEVQIKANEKTALLNIPQKEGGIVISRPTRETLYKASVMDNLDASQINKDMKENEITAYILKEPLNSGQKYTVTYTLAPHPLNGSKLTMIIIKAESIMDGISQFEVTPENKKILNSFRVQKNQTLEEKIDFGVEQFRGILKAKYNKKLILFQKFWYHSVLEFKIGDFPKEWGVIDALLVGESRTGKSSTAKAIFNTYGRGTTVAMAEATTAALIGGSDKKANGTMSIRAGEISMNHKGAMLLEELSKAKDQNIIAQLTEIRSSKEIKTLRVADDFRAPAAVRMLSVTNPKQMGKMSLPIIAYPNGIEITTDITGTPEDTARYDMIGIFAESANQLAIYDTNFKKPFPPNYYTTKINWVWSRSINKVVISDEVGKYIFKRSNELMKEYDSHIKIFGTETWKKLTKISLAVAAYVVSTDDNFENLILKEEHVNYAIQFMIELYDNDVFKFKQYIEEEKSYTTFNEEDVHVLKEVFMVAPGLIMALENTSMIARASLEPSSGLMSSDYNVQMGRLTTHKFIRVSGYNIMPTIKFRTSIKKIDRNTILNPQAPFIVINDIDEILESKKVEAPVIKFKEAEVDF